VDLQHPGLYGPALVMRTWGYGYLTDSWGDIPYFSALKGDQADGSLSPAYDDQKAIYTDFFAVLAKATTDMAAATTTHLRFGAADPIYTGNLTRWTRFSN
ncbi:MAG: SusD/RagB family nutrient-binding outer membrane lipoprotein, partial [Gemmatimonadota bacterium]|nr:SusD/RagB family nutrient-binding outer membrane lipoprotein [Gemmatimonadota bacterium]